jgi:hypothetical protein
LFAMARSLRSTSFSIPNLHSGRGTRQGAWRGCLQLADRDKSQAQNLRSVLMQSGHL